MLASVTWQVLFVAFFATVASKYVQGYYQASARELMRINGTTKAPIMNYAAETSLGVVTIRAFNMANSNNVEKMEALENLDLILLCLDEIVGGGLVFKMDELGLDITSIALPVAMALTADPIASLVDTAFIGQIDPVENTYKSEPLTDIVKSEHGKRKIPSASSALFIGSILGLVQTIFLILAAKPLLNIMGVKSDSPMLQPAQQYLTLRSLGAPAVLLSLAMQGVFRGFKDTKTPLYATVAGDAMNIILDPIFIFVFHLGISGAAIAHVISQYLISIILLWRLWQQVDLLPPSFKHMQFSRFLKNGFLLLMRVIAVTFCVTLAASMAARQGATSMAAFQVCLQVWLATSLLADGLAVAGQAILASAFAKKDYEQARATASRVLQLGLVLGFLLALILGVGLQFGAKLFTNDVNVLHLISVGIPFVAATQPINALAFVFDGVNFGASDFAYSAYSMVMVAIVSILILFVLSWSHGFIGIWVALTIYMSLRAFAGFWSNSMFRCFFAG